MICSEAEELPAFVTCSCDSFSELHSRKSWLDLQSHLDEIDKELSLNVACCMVGKVCVYIL